MERIWSWLSKPRTAQTAVGVLLVIAMRSILEFFRIGGATGTQLRCYGAGGEGGTFGASNQPDGEPHAAIKRSEPVRR
ncbi:hypothetical protein ACFFNA_15260, partial [Mesorhizobium kowhaii]|uniref:hypothetical protein n=1 Tax=Mesorhizobium kowhaii TaxID=1300272 RepID=UPI0035EDD2B1